MLRWWDEFWERRWHRKEAAKARRRTAEIENMIREEALARIELDKAIMEIRKQRAALRGNEKGKEKGMERVGQLTLRGEFEVVNRGQTQAYAKSVQGIETSAMMIDLPLGTTASEGDVIEITIPDMLKFIGVVEDIGERVRVDVRLLARHAGPMLADALLGKERNE